MTDARRRPRRTPRSAARRRVVQALGVAAGTIASGCASWLPPPARSDVSASGCASTTAPSDAFDYVIVGSGAGGGPLAARLALAGFSVLLLEAGGDEDSYEYEVPAFHPLASEDERYAWNFFVRHYADDAQQRRDAKYLRAQDGVLYPRSATLGGCTAHNAMILMYPHNSDWDAIAALTGDASWSSDNMRRYFERLERCAYVSRASVLSRHGYDGWLDTSVADPALIVRDEFVQRLVAAMLDESFRTLGRPVTRVLGRLVNRLDPNDWQLVEESGEGVCVMPVSIRNGHRVGSREFVRDVRDACPGRLTVRTHALATRVMLDATQRATGVEYLAGRYLYRADPRSGSADSPQRYTVEAKREVIVCAGAFNTPQLLKLSGIGPRDELERWSIPVNVALAGVGENLQDRYEVSVVTRMRGGFSLIGGMEFRPPGPDAPPDPQFREWMNGTGPYATNGSVISMMKRSSPERAEPDLFIFGLLGKFSGYFPGYSRVIARGDDYFTWAILKAHTNNAAGRVLLRSADPRDMPHVNFHYFEEGSGAMEDLAAVVEGVNTARRITGRCADIIAEELVPGPAVGTPDEIREFVRNNAWGHHASCSCRMGPRDDAKAVVDSQFRVHGTRGLRVVDASVFPRIPGFFLACAVYMVSEKAADVIIADARAASSNEATAATQRASQSA